MKILINDKLQQYHISKNKLAKMLDISYPTLLDLCSGKATSIRMDTLEKLCSIFHCTPNDILIPEQQKLKPVFDTICVCADNKVKSSDILNVQTQNDSKEISFKQFLQEYINSSLSKDKMQYQIRKDEHGHMGAFPYIIIDGYEELNHNKTEQDENNDSNKSNIKDDTK